MKFFLGGGGGGARVSFPKSNANLKLPSVCIWIRQVNYANVRLFGRLRSERGLCTFHSDTTSLRQP